MAVTNKKLLLLRRNMRRADLPLKKSAKHLVFGEGKSDASIMLIGEAPGRKEDEQGRPFVGAAGRELNRILTSAGFMREDVYITSILKYRPPNNRNPRKTEIEAHTPYLIKQIGIIRPKIIVTLGNYATRFILSHCDGMAANSIPEISRCHGKFYSISVNGRSFDVMPVYHPAAILYNRKLTKAVDVDFRKIRSAL